MSNRATLLAIVVCYSLQAQVRPVIFNLDSSEFFVKTFGPVVPKTIDEYVATMAGTSVSDLFICVNAQRTNYRSRVWEADWDGYDPNGGDAQPLFAGIAKEREFEREWIRTGYQWSQFGVDYPARMLAAARANRIRGWISVRMNDAHYPDQPAHPYHSKFWRDHPEWHLPNTSLDYAHSGVRAHYLALIREVLERFDMHGLELDFMRHGFYFRPDEVFRGVPVMTEFVREVRTEVKRHSVKRGHPIQLAVRVPTRPWIATSQGLDAVKWGKDGLVDWIVASNWWSSTQSDIPVEVWRGLLRGTPVKIAAALEDGIASGVSKRRTQKVEEARGIALSSIARGVDAVYLFNWFTGPLHEWPKPTYREFLQDSGDGSRLQKRPRRHPVTVINPWAEGEPGSAKPLAVTGDTVNLRIPIGPAPKANDKALIVIGVKSGPPPVSVTANATNCSSSADEGDLKVFVVAANALRGGYNLIRVKLASGTELNWAEIRITPAEAKP